MKVSPTARLPTPWGDFTMQVFTDDAGREHAAIWMGTWDAETSVVCRVHSECLTGDVFGSQRCDCGAQLHAAQVYIAEAGQGVILYLRQEGRGIGLHHKMAAYALQDEGADTVEANERLGFAADAREYQIARMILGHLGISKINLLTNNPRKINALNEFGVEVAERIALRVGQNPENQQYLHTKVHKLGHLL